MSGNKKPFKSIWQVTPSALMAASLSVHGAPQPPNTPENDQAALDSIQVTGTRIRNGAFQDALPVDVVTRDDIEALGSPQVADILQNLTTNTGALIRSSSFIAGRTTGTAQVNLRGLGPGATLVLINGRRQTSTGTVTNDGQSFVDINFIPSLFVERIEILKDGAAATYGSDAVAGVVNFIGRRRFEGLEVQTSYQDTTEDTQEDINFGFIWGNGQFNNGRTHLVLAGDYFTRDQLGVGERGFTEGDFNAGTGVSSFGSPGSFAPLQPIVSGPFAGLGSIAAPIRDPDCVAANGTALNSSGTLAGADPLIGRCGFEFADNFNLADDEERTSLFATITHDFKTDRFMQLNLEAGYYYNNIDDIGNSPSFPLLRFPVVPANNPGNPFGVDAVFFGRPLAENFPSALGFVEHETYRVAATLNGEINDKWGFEVSAQYSDTKYQSSLPDTLTDRFSAALVGMGGPNNDLFFNPFGSSFVNPTGIGTGGLPLGNDPAVINDFTDRLEDSTDTDLLVLEASLFNDNVFDLPAGPVGLAFGTQFRQEGYRVKRNDISTQTGAFIFLAGGTEFNESRENVSVFAELGIPILDNVDGQLAVRYENYSGPIGSSTDYKAGLRWEINDKIALRGSVTSTFKAPTLSQTTSTRTSQDPIVDLARRADGSTFGFGFRAVDTIGNADLDPEEADTFNFGLLLRPTENLELSIDYFRFEFDDIIVQETAQTTVDIENAINSQMGAVFGDANFFQDPSIIRNPDSGDIIRVVADFVNAPEVITDGFDLRASMALPTERFGLFDLTLSATYVNDFEIKGLQQVLADGSLGIVNIEGANSRNETNFARPVPEYRGSLKLGWSLGRQDANFIFRYISSYKDDDNSDARIDDFPTLDFNYRYIFDNDMSINFKAVNIFNREPPFVETDTNFDARTHTPFGRQLQLTISRKFF